MELLTLGRYILCFHLWIAWYYMDYLALYHEDISRWMRDMHGFALRAVGSRSLVLIIFVVQLPIQRCWRPSSSSFIDLNMSEVRERERRERDLVYYGPIVYWCCGRRGLQTWSAELLAGLGEVGLRSHSKYPLAAWSRFCALGANGIRCQKECQSKHLQSRQYGHVAKNLIQNHLPGTNSHQTQAQDTQGRWRSI